MSCGPEAAAPALTEGQMSDSKEIDLSRLLPQIRGIVEQQGEVVLQRWAGVTPFAAKDNRDFVTKVDIEMEEAIKDAIRQLCPSHGFRGEESEPEKPESPFQWLIDPIDGTKYYAAQSSLFSASVGLLHNEVPVLGVVYDPTSRQCFHAYKGGGSFLGSHCLERKTGRPLEQAIVNLDMPRSDLLSDTERKWYEEKLVELTRRVYRVRALGAGALSSCWLATGALDGFVDLTGYNKPQDVAAGRVIMAEAGIKVGELDPGCGPPRLLAAPPECWEQLEQLLLA